MGIRAIQSLSDDALAMGIPPPPGLEGPTGTSYDGVAMRVRELRGAEEALATANEAANEAARTLTEAQQRYHDSAPNSE